MTLFVRLGIPKKALIPRRRQTSQEVKRRYCLLRWGIQDNEGESGCSMSLQHCLDNETLFGCPLLKNRRVYSCPHPGPAHTHSLPGMTLLCGWVIGVALDQYGRERGRRLNHRGPHAESPECWTWGLTLCPASFSPGKRVGRTVVPSKKTHIL